MSTLSHIIICGQKFFGRNLTVKQEGIFVDGKKVDLGSQLNIDIVVQGDLDVLEVGAANSIAVAGSVGQLKTGSGDVTCGDVQGSVSTGTGDVQCGNVGGNIKTGVGDVITRRA